MNLNSENDKFYFIKIKVKKIKKMEKNEVIIEPPTIKQDNNPNYYFDLFGDKFIYCGIHLSKNGLKENGKPKKAPVFPYQYDKIEKSLIINWTSKNKLYKPNGIIILRTGF